jgi:hypothetical protein
VGVVWRRRALVAGSVFFVLAVGTAVGLCASVRWLRGHLASALGPGAAIGSLDVGLASLGVTALRLPGVPGWPARDALRAERVTIAPSLRSLLSRRIRVRSVQVDAPYVSMVRSRDGRLRVVPTLLERPAGTARNARSVRPPGEASRGTMVALGRVEVSDGEIELFDVTVGPRPWRLHLVGVDVAVESVVAPQFAGRMPLDVRATVDGPSSDGSASIRGWIDPGTLDLDLTVRLRGVDVRAFEPYVVTAGARVARGTFDLDLHATVRQRRLSAPGHVVLSHLAFDPAARGADRVMGVSRDLVLAALAERNGNVAFDFRLDGDVSDPRFSLNEQLAKRLATSLIGSLGLNVPGLVGGVARNVGGTLDGAQKLGEGVASALRGFFRR